MGIISFSLVLIPFVLLLTFLISMRHQDWMKVGGRWLGSAWGLAVLLALGVLFLPTYQWMDGYISPFGKPFDIIYTIMVYLIPLLALILATVLLFNGLM